MAAKLTPITVENAKPKKRAGALVRTEIPDRGCPGLFLIVQPSHVKAWALRYRVNGRSRKLTLGGADMAVPGALTLAAARAAAAQAQHRIALGADPAAEKQVARSASAQRTAQAAAETVEQMVEQFLELHTRRKLRATSLRAVEGIFQRFVLPAWRGRSIHDVKRRDVIALVEGIAARTPIMANRVVGALSKFFNWLVARDVIVTSPAKGVERPGIEQARDRVLDDGEIRALWLACGDPDAGVAGAAIRLLLLTGCRRSEIAELRWDEIDADKLVWTLPAARAKNKKTHAVPLTPQAWDIVSAQPRIGGHVFTTTGRGPIRNFDRLKRRLDAKLQFAQPWVIHDTRRAVASGLQRLGVRVEVIEAALNHTSGTFRGIVGIYQRHDFADEKRIALQRWADHVERLVSGQPATVVSFKGSGARPAP